MADTPLALFLETLNAQFAVPGHLTFVCGPGNLVIAEIKNSYAVAAVALLGGHVLRYQPHQQPPVVWLSPRSFFQPDKAIRGGIPVCWPWFGSHPTNPALPAHGFARTSPWTVLDSASTPDGATRLRLGLVDDENHRAMWPHPFRLELQMTIGAALEVALMTHNPGVTSFETTAALHTYFSVSDSAAVEVNGLAGVDYLDKVDGFRRKTQSGGITFRGETDRVFLDTSADCLIVDNGWRRQIRVSKQGSHTTVVWNPGPEKAAQMEDMGSGTAAGMVCVESANAAHDIVRVPPGGEHRLQSRITIESL